MKLKTSIAILLLGLSCFAETKDEWLSIMRGYNHNAIFLHFTKISKNAIDAHYKIESDVETILQTSKYLLLQLKEVEKDIQRGDLSGRTFRDVRLAEFAFEALQDSLSYYDKWFKKLVKAMSSPCEESKLQSITQGFNASSNVDIKKILVDFQNDIEKIINDANGENKFKDISVRFIVLIPIDADKGSKPQIQWFFDFSNNKGQVIVPADVAQLPGAAIVYGLVGIFDSIFGKDPTTELIHLLRQQCDNLASAATEIQTESISEVAKEYCLESFGEKETKTLRISFQSRWDGLISEINNLYFESKKIVERIESQHKENSTKLISKLALVENLINEKVEACYAEMKVRAEESRKYANIALYESLKILLNKSSTEEQLVLAEKNLWQAILHGDSKYFPGKYFSFQRMPDNELEMLPWKGITKALYKTLDRVRAEGRP